MGLKRRLALCLRSTSALPGFADHIWAGIASPPPLPSSPVLLLWGPHGLHHSPCAPAHCGWVSKSSVGVLLGYNCSPCVGGFRWKGMLRSVAGLLVGSTMGIGAGGVQCS